jgi:hypothetical protein
LTEWWSSIASVLNLTKLEAALRAVRVSSVVSIGHETVLMRQEIAGLRKAVEVATEVRGRKKKYIRAAESLKIGKVANLMAKMEGGRQEGGREPVRKVRARRRCGRCGETGHNVRTCAVKILDVSDSDESE